MSSDNPSGPLGAGRVSYIKTEGGQQRRVKYDREEDGTETFYSQAMHETRWHPFEPSDVERQAARWLLAHGRTSGENRLEDVFAEMGLTPPS